MYRSWLWPKCVEFATRMQGCLSTCGFGHQDSDVCIELWFEQSISRRSFDVYMFPVQFFPIRRTEARCAFRCRVRMFADSADGRPQQCLRDIQCRLTLGQQYCRLTLATARMMPA
jgi:hypothetical protein